MAKAAVVALVLVGVCLAAAWDTLEAKPKPCCTPDQWEGGAGSIGAVLRRRSPMRIQVRGGIRPTCMLSNSCYQFHESFILVKYKLTLKLTLSHPGGTHGLPDMQMSWYQSNVLRNIWVKVAFLISYKTHIHLFALPIIPTCWTFFRYIRFLLQAWCKRVNTRIFAICDVVLLLSLTSWEYDTHKSLTQVVSI